MSESELEQTKRLLSMATFSGVKQALETHVAALKRTSDSSLAANAPASAAVAPPAAPAAASTLPVPPASAAVRPSIVGSKAASSSSSVTYNTISDYAWDQGGYNSPLVTIFVELPGVGAVKDNVSFSCTASSFDLKVTGLDGKNYRLLNDNLDKDIVPEESKIIVKKDKVVIKLQKKKGQYSYETWSSLTAKAKRESEADKSKDPMGGLMGMMKNMYDEGDENMKKIIGEAMMQSRSGEKMKTPSMPSGDLDF